MLPLMLCFSCCCCFIGFFTILLGVSAIIMFVFLGKIVYLTVGIGFIAGTILLTLGCFLIFKPLLERSTEEKYQKFELQNQSYQPYQEETTQSYQPYQEETTPPFINMIPSAPPPPLYEVEEHKQREPTKEALLQSSSLPTAQVIEFSERFTELQVVKPSSYYHDLWATILFYINVATIVILSGRSIIWENVFHYMRVHWLSFYPIIIAVLAVFLVSIILGSVLVTLIVNYAYEMIRISLLCGIILNAFFAVVCLMNGILVGFIVFGIACLFNYCYMRAVLDRIPFASAIVRTSSHAIKSHYSGLLSTTVFSLVLQFIWFVLWITATYSVLLLFHHHFQDDKPLKLNAAEWTVMVLLIVSLFWGMGVINAVLQSTVAGSISSWWFQPDKKYAVRESFARAVTVYFGSLCFGTLLVAVISTIYEVITFLRRSMMSRNSGQGVHPVAACILGVCGFVFSLLETAQLYFNRYAFAYVSVYGEDFVTAGYQVIELFKLRGWTAIIGDNLIANVLALSVFGFSAICCLQGYLVGYLLNLFDPSSSSSNDSMIMLLAVLGAAIGFLISSLISNIIQSGVSTVFICYAESSQALQELHQREYHELNASWNYMYPSSTLI